jgi:uncharacterized coiled-coil DUF342 family protein
MSVEVTNTASWPVLTLLVGIAGLLITVLNLLWKGGGRSATVDAGIKRIADLEACLRDLKTQRATDREKDRISLEQHLASLHGGIALMKEQAAESREYAAKTYTTKQEIGEMVTRIFSHIDQISKRIETMDERVIKAISDRKYAGHE